jgi:uncharacterized protein YjbJ (UPF0337 family)
MDEDRIKGAAQDIGGRLKDAVGGLTGDIGAQIDGKLDQSIGQARNAFGRAKDAGRHAVSVAQDAASDAAENLYEGGLGITQSVSRAIEEQPLAAVLLAAAVGYGIACLVKRR